MGKNSQNGKGKPVLQSSTVNVSRIHKCAVCNRGLVRRKSKGRKGYWWGCSGYSEGCKKSYPDHKGKPDYSEIKPANKSVKKEKANA